MAEIYKNALLVIAELGPAWEDQQSALRKMEYLSTFMWTESQRIESEGKRIAISENVRLPPEFVEPYDAEMWEGLASFFRRPWWTRVWIVQEATAISSYHTRLLCGIVEVLLEHASRCNVAGANSDR